MLASQPNHRLIACATVALLTLLSLGGAGCHTETAEARAAQRASLAAVKPAFVNRLGMAFVRIPPQQTPADTRSISMSKATRSEPPAGEFLIGAHEVTVGQFRQFVASTGYLTEAERDAKGGWEFDPETGGMKQIRGRSWKNPGFVQGENHPVVQVSWKDAEAFCAWLSQQTSERYRLPTEREWERACRGGHDGLYSYGDDPGKLHEVANFADAPLVEHLPFATWAVSEGDGFAFTAPVGSLRPNAYGLHDGHGNVWEWCADWYVSPVINESSNPDAAGFRVIRGGGWSDPPERCRTERSIYFRPAFRYCHVSGFRVLLAN